MQRTSLPAASSLIDLSTYLLQVLVPGNDTGSATTVIIAPQSSVSSSLSSHALQPCCCALFPILSLLPWVCQLPSSAHACRPRHPRCTRPRHQGTLCSQRAAALQVQYSLGQPCLLPHHSTRQPAFQRGFGVATAASCRPAEAPVHSQ